MVRIYAREDLRKVTDWTVLTMRVCLKIEGQLKLHLEKLRLAVSARDMPSLWKH
jgi:hypothetical protein